MVGIDILISLPTQGVSNMNTAPASGTLTIPSGASITVLWCQGDNGQMPEGCVVVSRVFAKRAKRLFQHQI